MAGGDEGGGANTDDGLISVHINALDGIVSHNSLFTAAVFAGLATSGRSSSGGSIGSACSAGPQVQQDLVSFHVYAFAAFLFSSLVALALKQAIRNGGPPGAHAPRVDRALLRAGLMAAAAGSMFGCGFMMLALVMVVQVQLGTVYCGGASAAAIVPLVTLTTAAIIIYSIIVLRAFAGR